MKKSLLPVLIGLAASLGAAPKPADVFLLLGQSNMAGRGPVEAEDTVPIPGVQALGPDDQWHPAVDPLHWDKPEIAGTGLARSFARALLSARPGTTIGLVPAAVGGTSLDQWCPDGELYTEALRRARVAMADGTRLRGILWHQGEADSDDAGLAATYSERWLTLTARLRADLATPDAPILVGQLGSFVPAYVSKDGSVRNVHADTVNSALALLPLRARRVGFVSSAGLTDKGDSLHFDSASLREFGRRYACMFLLLAPDWAAPPEPLPVD